VTGQPVEEVFRGIIPFLIPLLAVLVLVSAFPAVSLWLPRVLGF
jgi:TRAP-type C4-dicarboxylate transport system permease large subunit